MLNALKKNKNVAKLEDTKEALLFLNKAIQLLEDTKEALHHLKKIIET